jgi:D-amino peptidase
MEGVSMKYMVRCDMDGISGVVSRKQITPGSSEYEYGRRMLKADLIALLRGLRDGGAEEVLLYDLHYYGRNIDISELPEYARLISGRPPYLTDWAGGLDDTFEGVILLGFPARLSTIGGILGHSYGSDILDLRLNGVSVGAIGMEAAIAGDFDVPVVMVTGDTAGITEATSLLPGVFGVVVKDTLSQSGGICYPLSVTSNLIQTAASRVASDPPDVEPYTLDSGVALEVELNDGEYLETVSRLFASSMKDEKTLALHGERTLDVWVDYQQKRRTARETLSGSE